MGFLYQPEDRKEAKRTKAVILVKISAKSALVLKKQQQQTFGVNSDRAEETVSVSFAMLELTSKGQFYLYYYCCFFYIKHGFGKSLPKLSSFVHWLILPSFSRFVFVFYICFSVCHTSSVVLMTITE